MSLAAHSFTPAYSCPTALLATDPLVGSYAGDDASPAWDVHYNRGVDGDTDLLFVSTGPDTEELHMFSRGELLGEVGARSPRDAAIFSDVARRIQLM